MPSYRLRVPASPQSVKEVRDAVAAAAREADISNVWAVRMCLSEAVTNVVVHAYGDDQTSAFVDIAVAIPEPGTLRVTVSDAGHGFQARRESPGLGLGLPTIAKLASEVDIRSGSNGGTVLYMNFSEAEMRSRSGSPSL